MKLLTPLYFLLACTVIFSAIFSVTDAQAQLGILSLEARLQLNHLESLERVEKERTAKKVALKGMYSEKLIELNKRLKGLGKEAEAEVVADEVRLLGEKNPAVVVREEDPLVLNEFRSIYLKELNAINQATDEQRTALVSEYATAKAKMASAVPAPEDVAKAPVGTPLPAYQPAAVQGKTSMPKKTIQTNLGGAEGVREYRVPNTDYIKIVQTNPAMPAKLAVGQQVEIRVVYNKLTSGRASISLYPFASEGANYCVSRSRNVYADGEGEVTLWLKATGPTLVDRLAVEMTHAVTDKHITRDTENARILWYAAEK